MTSPAVPTDVAAHAGVGEPAPVPTRTVVRSVLIAVASVACVVLAMMALEPAGIPDRVETIGPFELVVRSAGRAGHPSMQWFSVRYRGQPVVVHGKAGMYGDSAAEYDTFHSAITFGAPAPVLIVNVGDPINSGFFYLLREQDGRVVTEYLGHSSGGVTAEFLDVPAKGRAGSSDRNLTTKRARLGSGRWLLLGDYCVFDTQALKGYSISESKDAAVNQSASPVALSPDQRSFVRLGTQHYPGNEPMLLVFDFVSDVSYALPIDKEATRFDRWEDVDRAWVEHYYEWKPGENGHDRLARRMGVAPLPYRGTLRTDASGYREYRLSPVSTAMVGVLADFLVREFGATRLDASSADGERVELKVGEATLHVSGSEGVVTVWMNRDAGRTKIVADLAARFDQELATGRHDALFHPPDAEADGDGASSPANADAGASHPE